MSKEIISHHEFIQKAADANKVGSRTKDHMGPESEEDHAMYALEKGDEQ